MTVLKELIALYENAYEDMDQVEAESFSIVEEGEWVQDHKYQHKTSIVKFKDLYFAINESRAGSYYTDWDNIDTDIYEVERTETTKVVVTWKRKR